MRKTEAWAVSGWLDSMLLKLACLFKVEDGHGKDSSRSEKRVWNRFARAKRSERHDPPVAAGVAGGGLLRIVPWGVGGAGLVARTVPRSGHRRTTP